jgi:hypothetical protein
MYRAGEKIGAAQLGRLKKCHSPRLCFYQRFYILPMMRTPTLVARTAVALLCLCGASMLAHAGTLKRHWEEIEGLRISNATIITKNGHRYRGHLVITQTGAIVTHHGTYQKWVTATDSPEIPGELVARILVRHRYRLTMDEQDDVWWYVAADWKAIFYPELSNLFPIAVLAHTGFTGGAVLYTPIGVIAALCRPPASDTIEILPD